jgi:hypothetical protein
MHIHRLMAIALIATSVALVGCGGGGGGSSKKSSNNNTPSTTPIVQDDQQQPATQGPTDDDLADLGGDPSDPELLLPVDTGNPGGDDLALNTDPNGPGQIAANPEPASAALAAMGLAFLATRRYGRREA